MANEVGKKKGLGMAPVFFTAISTILGAILFLRFGYAVGELGFYGAILIVICGHLVTIPTSLAISEIATNQKVEGGGEYFIISRSFGLNIGATIGIALFFSQAISVAFYVIAFTEAFTPLLHYLGWENIPKQIISIPTMLLLSVLILKKGADIGIKLLYVVVGILFVSLLLFFLGANSYASVPGATPFKFSFSNLDSFFIVFAIIFPAFTGMTAGVGLSGDLKEPSKSIPRGTILGTVVGMIIYGFIAWKLAASASPNALTNTDNLVMADIALWGFIAIPVGLAASTLSSALGSILVAPRTLQALGGDKSFPFKKVNKFISSGKGENKEPYAATIITVCIALVFVGFGEVDVVAKVISMFFMVTYGSLCLISFLNHFGADPSYRPAFKSKWYISLIGFIGCLLFMFLINAVFAIASIIAMGLLYFIISKIHKDRGGLQGIFLNAIFQLTRKMQVYLQRSEKSEDSEKWRPAVVCVSKDTFKRDAAVDVMDWIAYKYGFGTYIHLVEGYYSKETNKIADETLQELITKVGKKDSNVYLDTMISPSYTSAVAQVIQLPSISGKENNMILFEFDRESNENVNDIIDNYNLVKAGNLDVCILGSTYSDRVPEGGIHIWIEPKDEENINLMILMGFIILGHPYWKKGKIKVFNILPADDKGEGIARLLQIVKSGRLPISKKNIEFIYQDEEKSLKTMVKEKSGEAALTLVGFNSAQIKHQGQEVFKGYDGLSNILFVNASEEKVIE